MQKKLIALAVAGLSTAAFAQTNVTIYGVADVSAQGTNVGTSTDQSNGYVNKGSKFGPQSNNSLIGFKGTEDLGNGLKALFQMETNINLTGSSTGAQSQGGVTSNGAGASVGGNAANSSGAMIGSMRDSFVGMSSKFGTAMAGYLSTPLRSTVAGLDVMPGATGSAGIQSLFSRTNMASQYSSVSAKTNVAGNSYGVNGLGFVTGMRTTAIAYALPTMYGINGSIAYTGNSGNSLTQCNGGTDCNANQNVTGMSMNLGWDGYGIGLRGAFQQLHVNLNNGTAPGTNNTNALSGITSYLLGATYTGLPGLKASVAYQRNTIGLNAVGTANSTAVGAAKGSQNQIYAGVSYRFGNNEPAVMYASNSNISGLGGTNAAGNPAYAGQDGATQWGARWGYYLSKRTQVYGIVSQIKNNANANYDFLNTSSTSNAQGGSRLVTYGAGLRTNF